MTHLAWVDTLPDCWAAKPLRACAEYMVSNVDKLTADDEVPVRLCNYTNVYNNESITLDLDFMKATATAEEVVRFGLRVDDVIITKDSETWDDIGVPALVRESASDLVCGYHLALLRPRQQRMDGAFLLRCLQAKPLRVQLELAANGVTRFGIQKSDIGGMKLPVPPFSQQRTIADYLDREAAQIDAVVVAKQRFLSLLADKQRALVARILTRGNNPSGPMQDTGIDWLGKIPKTWVVKRVKYLFRLITDAAPDDNEYELLSLYTDVGVRPRKELEARGNRATTTDGYWIARRGDLVVNKLLAWMGAFGVSDYDGVTSPAYDVLRPSPAIDSMYYHYLFRCGICFPEFRRRSSGIMDMRLRLYFDQLGDMPVPVPPLDEQRVIVDRIAAETRKLDAIRTATEKTITLLKERRAALITAAVTGQTEVA